MIYFVLFTPLILGQGQAVEPKAAAPAEATPQKMSVRKMPVRFSPPQSRVAADEADERRDPELHHQVYHFRDLEQESRVQPPKPSEGMMLPIGQDIIFVFVILTITSAIPDSQANFEKWKIKAYKAIHTP